MFKYFFDNRRNTGDHGSFIYVSDHNCAGSDYGFPYNNEFLYYVGTKVNHRNVEDLDVAGDIAAWVQSHLFMEYGVVRNVYSASHENMTSEKSPLAKHALSTDKDAMSNFRIAGHECCWMDQSGELQLVSLFDKFYENGFFRSNRHHEVLFIFLRSKIFQKRAQRPPMEFQEPCFKAPRALTRMLLGCCCQYSLSFVQYAKFLNFLGNELNLAFSQLREHRQGQNLF